MNKYIWIHKKSCLFCIDYFLTLVILLQHFNTAFINVKDIIYC